jgi:hypothetical protein
MWELDWARILGELPKIRRRASARLFWWSVQEEDTFRPGFVVLSANYYQTARVRYSSEAPNETRILPQ